MLLKFFFFFKTKQNKTKKKLQRIYGFSGGSLQNLPARRET